MSSTSATQHADNINHFDRTVRTTSVALFSAATHYSRAHDSAVRVTAPLTMGMNGDVVPTHITHKLAPVATINNVNVPGVIAALPNTGLTRAHAIAGGFADTSTQLYHETSYTQAYLTRAGETYEKLVKAHMPKTFSTGGIEACLGYLAATEAMWNFTHNYTTIASALGVANAVMPVAVGKDYVPMGNSLQVVITRDTRTLIGDDVCALIATICSALGGVCIYDTGILNVNGVALVVPTECNSELIQRTVRFMYQIAVDNDRAAAFHFHIGIGVTRFITVVAESDEGGVLRDLIRCGTYAAPHGVLNITELSCASPFGANVVDMRTAAYSYALNIAGCLTAADPTVLFQDNTIPTMVTNDCDDMEFSIPANSTGAFIASLTTNRIIGASATIQLIYKLVSEGVIAFANAIPMLDQVLGQLVPNTTCANITNGDLAALVLYSLKHWAKADFVTFIDDNLADFTAANAACTVSHTNIQGIIRTINMVINPQVVLDALLECFTIRNGLDNFCTLHSDLYGSQGLAEVKHVFSHILSAYVSRVKRTYSAAGRVVGGYYYGSRHISRPLLQLFSWIEVTGLFEPSVPVPYITQLNGSYVKVCGSATYPAFRGEFLDRPGEAEVYFCVDGSHTFRSLHILNFYRNHVNDGLAGIYYSRGLDATPYCAISDMVGDNNVGGTDAHATSALTWSIATNTFPFSGEFLSLAQASEYAYHTHKTVAGMQHLGRAREVRNHLYSPNDVKGAEQGSFKVAPPDVSYKMGYFTTLPAQAFAHTSARYGFADSSTKRYTALSKFTKSLVAHDKMFAVRPHNYTFASSYNIAPLSDDGSAPSVHPRHFMAIDAPGHGIVKQGEAQHLIKKSETEKAAKKLAATVKANEQALAEKRLAKKIDAVQLNPPQSPTTTTLEQQGFLINTPTATHVKTGPLPVQHVASPTPKQGGGSTASTPIQQNAADSNKVDKNGTSGTLQRGAVHQQLQQPDIKVGGDELENLPGGDEENNGDDTGDGL